MLSFFYKKEEKKKKHANGSRRISLRSNHFSLFLSSPCCELRLQFLQLQADFCNYFRNSLLPPRHPPGNHKPRPCRRPRWRRSGKRSPTGSTSAGPKSTPCNGPAWTSPVFGLHVLRLVVRSLPLETTPRSSSCSLSRRVATSRSSPVQASLLPPAPGTDLEGSWLGWPGLMISRWRAYWRMHQCICSIRELSQWGLRSRSERNRLRGSSCIMCFGELVLHV